MITYKAFTLLLMLSVVKSELDFGTMCKNDYRLMNNTQIDVSKFCATNTCIEKCCGEGEMIALRGHCINIKAQFQKLKKPKKSKKNSVRISDVDYSKVVLYSWDGNAKNISKKNFIFIKNQRHPNCTSDQTTKNEYFILEDGSIKMQDTGSSNTWFDIKRLEYCVDFRIVISGEPQVKLIVKEYNADPADDYKKAIFVLVGLLISSFFLLLVLVVYSVLPKLQNLIGLVLMAYTASLLVTFLVKIVKHFINASLTKKHCKIIAPVMYFAAVSSFFWLNVMSFDVWWSLRGCRKRRDINRRGERVKFMWYCLYAWGTALLMTAVVTILDNIDLSNLNIIKPPFEDFFVNPDSVNYYFMIPIGIIIFVNIILFLLTVYNIWMIKCAVYKCQDSRRSSQDTNRFITYIKLSVLMGVSWILELVPAETGLAVFILVNLFNLLVGVTIFFLFVFNKGTFLKLCNRFNIKNKFTNSFEVSQTSRSGTTKTTRFSSKNHLQEMDLLKNCPKGESIEVADDF